MSPRILCSAHVTNSAIYQRADQISLFPRWCWAGDCSSSATLHAVTQSWTTREHWGYWLGLLREPGKGLLDDLDRPGCDGSRLACYFGTLFRTRQRVRVLSSVKANLWGPNVCMSFTGFGNNIVSQSPSSLALVLDWYYSIIGSFQFVIVVFGRQEQLILGPIKVAIFLFLSLTRAYGNNGRRPRQKFVLA